MEDQAKEELEMLESLYPDRFQYLKLDLKSFISQHRHVSEPSSFRFSMADTQESSSLNQWKKKRKHKSTAHEDCDQHVECYRWVNKKKKDRVDLVLERAEACLRKIRQFKASLLCDS